jgi:SulP family sulfate permease
VVYSKSQGDGKRSSLSIVTITIAIFIYGPTIASYVPRCMAGTLLLHLGIDLFLEGGIESYGDYDTLEYSGICLIMFVMVLFGMDQALLAGLVSALSTFVAQSIVYQDPIRGAMSGARLRSSAWNRSSEAQQILLDPKIGRGRIYVVELQGHIFFGNIVKLTEDIKQRLNQKRQAGDEPIVVILDFSDVLGVDSSAAQSIVKLKIFIQKNFNVKILLFVTGHEDGFLCSYDLSHKVVDELGRKSIHIVENKPLVKERRMSLAAGALANHVESQQNVIAEIPRSQVFETIDDALIFAEDVLIALVDPTIIQTDCHERFPLMRCTSDNIDEVNSILETIMPEASEDEIQIIANLLTPEKYQRGDTVWEQGDASDSLKVVVSGSLISLLEDVVRNSTESICPGAVIGESGLVNRNPRLTTVQVLSEDAILYSLSREKWQTLTEQQPKVARYIDMLVIRYLFHRIQHVSNNRSLPV